MKEDGVHRRGSREDKRAAKPQHDGYGHGAEKLAHGVGHLLAAHHGVPHAEIHLVLAMEAFLYLAFGIEGLDYAQAAEGFLDVGHEQAPLVLYFEALAFEAFAHAPHHQAGERQQD